MLFWGLVVLLGDLNFHCTNKTLRLTKIERLILIFYGLSRQLGKTICCGRLCFYGCYMIFSLAILIFMQFVRRDCYLLPSNSPQLVAGFSFLKDCLAERASMFCNEVERQTYQKSNESSCFHVLLILFAVLAVLFYPFPDTMINQIA